LSRGPLCRVTNGPGECGTVDAGTSRHDDRRQSTVILAAD